MYKVYILQSLKDLRTYIGFTLDPIKRLSEHNSGKVDATRNRKPFKILFIENAETLAMAKDGERYWKSGAGRRKLKKFFKDGFPPISEMGEARSNKV